MSQGLQVAISPTEERDIREKSSNFVFTRRDVMLMKVMDSLVRKPKVDLREIPASVKKGRNRERHILRS